MSDFKPGTCLDSEQLEWLRDRNDREYSHYKLQWDNLCHFVSGDGPYVPFVEFKE